MAIFSVMSFERLSVQTMSLVNRVDHNSKHVSPFYVIPQNYIPYTNFLTSNTLYSATFCYSAVNLNKTV